MEDIESFVFNPDVLKSLRLQLSYSATEVASLSGISMDRYDAIENSLTQPNSIEMKALAKFFRVKEFNFFRKSPPSKSSDVNFRAQLPGYKGEPGPILDAIEFAAGVQRLLHSVSDTRGLWRTLNRRAIAITADVESEAHWWRNDLDILDDIQIKIKSNDKFFTFLRSRIESKGISVLVSSYEEKSFKGLVFGSREKVPVILINSYRQQKSSRSFTLAHEFCHVLLEDDGVSNPYNPVTKVERFCNKFAAALLMPRALLTSLLEQRQQSATSNSTIKWLSNKLKVSMEAVVIRLVECGFAESNFWRIWKSQFETNGYLPSEEAISGGGTSDEGVDQGIVKLAYFGFLFGQLVPEGLSKSGLTGMAVFKASRLKPRYLPALARAAKERLAEVGSYGRT